MFIYSRWVFKLLVIFCQQHIICVCTEFYEHRQLSAVIESWKFMRMIVYWLIAQFFRKNCTCSSCNEVFSLSVLHTPKNLTLCWTKIYFYFSANPRKLFLTGGELVSHEKHISYCIESVSVSECIFLCINDKILVCSVKCVYRLTYCHICKPKNFVFTNTD